MQSIGSEKLSLPMLLNPDGWKKTGRWDGAKGEVREKNKSNEMSKFNAKMYLVFSL